MEKRDFTNIASLIAIVCLVIAIFLNTQHEFVLQYANDGELNTEVFNTTKEYNNRVAELKEDSTIIIYNP